MKNFIVKVYGHRVPEEIQRAWDVYRMNKETIFEEKKIKYRKKYLSKTFAVYSDKKIIYSCEVVPLLCCHSQVKNFLVELSRTKKCVKYGVIVCKLIRHNMSSSFELLKAMMKEICEWFIKNTAYDTWFAICEKDMIGLYKKFGAEIFIHNDVNRAVLRANIVTTMNIATR